MKKRNYVIYVDGNNCNIEEGEHVVRMTEEQAKAIEWFMNTIDISGCIELAENYSGEEI